MIAEGWDEMTLMQDSAIAKGGGGGGYCWGRLEDQKALPARTTWEARVVEPRFEHIFHQTRCPLLNIAALLTHGRASAAFASVPLGLQAELPSKDCFEAKAEAEKAASQGGARVDCLMLQNGEKPLFLSAIT